MSVVNLIRAFQPFLAVVVGVIIVLEDSAINPVMIQEAIADKTCDILV